MKLAVHKLVAQGKKFSKVVEIHEAIRAIAGRIFSNRTLYKGECKKAWEKLLEVAQPLILPTMSEEAKKSKSSESQKSCPELASEMTDPECIECLAHEGAQPRSLGAAPLKLFLGIMGVSASKKPETISDLRIFDSEETLVTPTSSSEGADRSVSDVEPWTATENGKNSPFRNSADSLNSSDIQQLKLLDVIHHANLEPSKKVLSRIWMNSFVPAKAVVDRMSKEACEPFSSAVYGREMLVERLRLFWSGVPPSWVDFARDWFVGLNIDPGWP